MHEGGGIFGFETYGGTSAPPRPGPSMYGREGFEPYGSETGMQLGLDPIEISVRANEIPVVTADLQRFLPIGLGIAVLLFLMRGR